MLSTLILAAIATLGVQANPLNYVRDSTESVNGGGGTCANPEEVRGPIEGHGCSKIENGCCTVNYVDENHSYSWESLTTDGDHGYIQAFSDDNCYQDASPVVHWVRGACVDTNGSGKTIRSVRRT